VKKILQLLDMEITDEKEAELALSVPAYRTDVTREIDVIEEVLRIYGYGHIPLPEQLNTSLSFLEKPDKEAVTNTVADYLTANGFMEMVANSVVPAVFFEKHQNLAPESLVKLLKSSNAELDTMRPNMLFSGLEMIRHNHNRHHFDIRCFEFGKSYWKENGTYHEAEHLALFVSGNYHDQGWRSQAAPVDFYHLKGMVNNIMQRLGLFGFQTAAVSEAPFAYGQSWALNGKPVVTFGAVSNDLLEAMEVKGPVFYADMLWEPVLRALGRQAIRYEELPKYPATRRDLALLIDRQVSFEQLETIARKEGRELLRDINIFDVYRDQQMGKGKKSYAISLLFRDDRKTITDKQVDKIMKRLMQRYQHDLNAAIR